MNNTTVSYQVYAAGGLFTQHELTTNVLIKEAVWQLSNGKYELILPQSKELRDLDRPDIAAFIRNADLLQVTEADAVLARFDGVELDAGTLVEYMFDLPPQYVPVLMIVQPIEFEKVGPGLKQALGDDIPAHCAV
jgi:nucleoside 2-deoxyribosyltransferase